jgi:MOSC domain-containing protein
MTPFDLEVRDCLAVILQSELPAPDGDALTFFGQWLAERNLGLVPVADPDAFAWPGPWIAGVRRGDRRHAVVMFGSPAGPLHDPEAVLAGGGTIEQGWLLARLDVRLPIDEPYGTTPGAGRVAAILVADAAERPLVRVDTGQAVEGRGLEGDRYHAGQGTFSKPGRGYQLTLVEAEVLDDIGLPWEAARRNIVTTGIELNALVGRRFAVGHAECIGRRLAEPCSHLERLARPGILRPLVHRGGLRADILRGGTISLGDRIAAIG